MAVVSIGNVQPEAAIAAFRARGNSMPGTWSWSDMWQEEHRRAFTVAKSAGFDILGDIFDAMDAAISKGTTFEDFSKRLTPVLQQKGWWGKKEVVNPQTGEKRLVQLGSPRRLKTIFDTNMRVSYAAGKWERFQRTKKLLPYLMYSAVLDQKTRPLHARWGGRPDKTLRVVLPVDHPWWTTHFPPNGWHCRCTVTALSRAQVIRMGLDPDNLTPPPISTTLWRNPRTGQRIRVPNGIDPGFGYNPGRAPLDPLVPRRVLPEPPAGMVSVPWRLSPQTSKPPRPAPAPGSPEPSSPTSGSPGSTPAAPAPGPAALPPDGPISPPGVPPGAPGSLQPGAEAAPALVKPLDLYPPIGRPRAPPPRVLDPSLILPDGLPPEDYLEAFLRPFGATPATSAIHIDPAGMPLPVSAAMFARPDGRLKTSDFGRGPLLPLVAQAILRPQEIWIEIDAMRRLVRRYLLRFHLSAEPGLDEEAGLILFSLSEKGWVPLTAYPVKAGKSVEARRRYIDQELRRGFLVWRER